MIWVSDYPIVGFWGGSPNGRNHVGNRPYRRFISSSSCFLFFGAEPQPVHFADIGDGSESANLLLFQPCQQPAELVFAEQRLSFDTFFAAVVARHLVKGATAVQVGNNVLADMPVLFRHNAYALAVARHRREIIHHKAVHPSAYKPDDNHAERADEKVRCCSYCL